MASPADLGKVHTKVVLYDKIPGVIRDPKNLRKSYSFTVGFDADDDAVPASYDMEIITVTDSSNNKSTGCMMPRPMYEPVNNYMSVDTNSAKYELTDVFWKEIGNKEPDVIGDDYKSGFEKIGALEFRESVSKKDKSVLSHNRQLWTSRIETVSAETFSEEDYDRQPINYKGEGYAYAKKKKDEKKETTTTTQTGTTTTTPVTTTTDPTISDVENRSFVSQVESAASTWWAIKTVNEAKWSGWPFWITIRTSSLSIRKDSYPNSLISIKIRDGASSRPYKSSYYGKRDAVGDIELLVDSVGNVIMSYEVKSLKEIVDNSKKTDTNKTKKDGNKKTEVVSSWRTIPVNLPELSDAIREKREMRVGIIQVLGRICLYLSKGNYNVVTLLGTDDQFMPINLDTSGVEVCGYGLSASVSVCPMTFSKHAWMVLPNMKEEFDKGHTFPVSDSGSTRAKSLSDGRFISKPVSQELRDAASGKKSGDGKMYGGTFKYYKEVLLNADSEKTASARESSSSLQIEKENPFFAMFNMWGRIHIVRSDAVNGISKKPFWFLYMGTQKLYRPAHSPDGKGITPESGYDGHTLTYKADGGKEVTYKAVSSWSGYPTMFSINGYKEQVDDSEKYEFMNGSIDISDDVIQVDISSQLDSPRPTSINKSGTVRVFNAGGRYSEYLTKARGIRVWMKWSVKANTESEPISFTDADIVFSGIAFGRSKSQAPGEDYVNFECKDHWLVLEGSQIRNSPFYDGFEVGAVVEDICGRAGIGFESDIDYSNAKKGGPQYLYLGQGMAVDKPLYRFSSEKNLSECIMETVKNYEVMLYFDNDGKLHMSTIPGGFLFNENADGWDSRVKERYYIIMDDAPEPHNVILDGLEINSTLSSSIYNSFFIMSADRSTGSLLVASGSRPESITKPDDIGYLGFVKEIRIQRPDLGVQRAVEWYLETVKKMYSKPGFEVDFSTVGHVPSYRPGHFIRLIDKSGEGEIDDFSERKFRVTKVDHSYSASDNKWVTKIGAYQVEPAAQVFKPTEGNEQSTPSQGEDGEG